MSQAPARTSLCVHECCKDQENVQSTGYPTVLPRKEVLYLPDVSGHTIGFPAYQKWHNLPL